MNHETAERIIICTGTYHFDLSTATFFGRSPHSNYASTKPSLLHGLGDAKHGGKSGRSNQVVATCVANSFQSVISTFI